MWRKPVGGAFFSSCHRALRGEELRIRLPAPHGVRKKHLVELVETGPRAPPAAAGEVVAFATCLEHHSLTVDRLELPASALCQASLRGGNPTWTPRAQAPPTMDR